MGKKLTTSWKSVRVLFRCFFNQIYGRDVYLFVSTAVPIVGMLSQYQLYSNIKSRSLSKCSYQHWKVSLSLSSQLHLSNGERSLHLFKLLLVWCPFDVQSETLPKHKFTLSCTTNHVPCWQNQSSANRSHPSPHWFPYASMLFITSPHPVQLVNA